MEKNYALPKKIELERPPQKVEKEKLPKPFRNLFERIRALSDQIKKSILDTSSQFDRAETMYIPQKNTSRRQGEDVLTLSVDAQKKIHEKIQDGTLKLAEVEKKRNEIMKKTDTRVSNTINQLNEQRCTDAVKNGTEIPEYVRRAIVQQRAIRQSRASRSGSVSLKI